MWRCSFLRLLAHAPLISHLIHNLKKKGNKIPDKDEVICISDLPGISMSIQFNTID